MAADESWRLFLAVWPSPSERECVQAQADRWEWSGAARRTDPARLHLTLHFIGPVPADRVQQAADALQVDFEPFTVRFDRAQVWPGGIAVLEAMTVPPALARLHARLADALHRLDLPRELRPYRPHVTLARKAQASHAPADATAIRWQVGGGYALVRSLPGGQGYRTLRRYTGETARGPG